MKKFFKYSALFILLFAVVFTAYFISVVQIDTPVIEDVSALEWQVEELTPGLTKINGGWFRKSNLGLFEIFVSGNPFERGVTNGKLAEKLVVRQEEIFVAQIRRIVPSETYLKFLKYLVGWFNKELPNHVPKEQLEEI